MILVSSIYMYELFQTTEGRGLWGTSLSVEAVSSNKHVQSYHYSSTLVKKNSKVIFLNVIITCIILFPLRKE